MCSSMHKQRTFFLTAAILLTAIVSVDFYTVNAANAQSNMSSSSANMTKSNMTNATSSAAKNTTGPVMGAAGKAKNMTGK